MDQYIAYVLEKNLHSPIETKSPEEQELELIYKINQLSLTSEEWLRYKKLKEARKKESLNKKEHKELLSFSNKLEELDAKRLEHLLSLSQLKNESLEKVMKSLGIHPPSYE